MSDISRKPFGRILFIDAYDSFSCNIINLLQTTLDAEIRTLCMDAHISEDELPHLLRYFDAVVVGPGPGNPTVKEDVGLIDYLWRLEDANLIPVLGICLGFQSLALAYGATIARLVEPQHGQIATISHNGKSIFQGIGSLHATLYHSLHAIIHDKISNSDQRDLWKSELCPSLEPLAWNVCGGSDGPVLMGVKHVNKPFWGVQFHPESICSGNECKQAIRNWARESNIWGRTKNRTSERDSPLPILPILGAGTNVATTFKPCPLSSGQGFQIITKSVDLGNLNVPDLCEMLGLPYQDTIILESRAFRQGLGKHSIIGVLSNDYMRLEYSVENSFVSLTSSQGKVTQISLNGGTVWQWLEHFLQEIDVIGGTPSIPFWGGFMGFFSYEAGLEKYSIPKRKDAPADISLVLVQRSMVVNHETGKIYIQSIIEHDDWPRATAKRLVLQTSLSAHLKCNTSCKINNALNIDRQNIKCRKAVENYLHNAIFKLPDEETYKARISRAQEAIRAGDSYEICLTDETTITIPSSKEPTMSWQLYNLLRDRNPAPFAAYVSLGDLQILSSSPELFLNRERQGSCSLRPMKGTVKKTTDMTRDKAEAILASTKERAENLMIVDLIRHDLHSVMGTIGDVSVPELMVIEDFETVYQMSSRIEAQIFSSIPKQEIPTAVDTLRACLPPGSMTGAPKKRSCEILNDLEERPRQAYSGVLGYLDFGGAAQFSVLIRSAFKHKTTGEMDVWRIGAGGAITALSTVQGEWEEMLTKLESTLSSFRLGDRVSQSS
ncbi:MAG: hypothetical protein M1834_000450 [Cirrosporium novae-zelandiae]|nr:MAG: hypothetical protein M1834_000450 [Cirrosporium novae-zelandiae]